MKRAIQRLLTARQAADFLGISLNTLRRIEKAGLIIPYRTPGGHRRYSSELLQEYLERSRRVPAVKNEANLFPGM